ncbi:MAG: imidazoleglycerol-phosphate dehydratase HisB [bacterium]|nr:imidazoleglycerol-phosphate dehydratase HisB [bacterium]
MSRTAKIERTTKETQIKLELDLDGIGKYQIDTPIGFFNHMLELFSKHGLFDLTIKATGDVEYDDHHIIEDVGIVLGQAINKAIGNKKGIKRYGSQILPMDEVLCLTAVDLAGRFAYEDNYQPVREKVNDFPTEMLWHFMQQVALEAKMNLHIQFLNSGRNEHHRLEAIFKSFARALREACEIEERAKNQLPSTKNKL